MASRMLMIDEENTPLNNAKRITRNEVGKQKRAKALLSGLKKAKEAKQVEAQLIMNRQHEIVEEEIQLKKEMLAVASRNLEDLTHKVQTCSSELIEVEKKLKSKKVLIKYYEKNDSIVPVLDDVAYLCEVIERACYHLKGKHASTKGGYSNICQDVFLRKVHHLQHVTILCNAPLSNNRFPHSMRLNLASQVHEGLHGKQW
jgi:Mg2+ and Co2+ transporter CorA